MNNKGVLYKSMSKGRIKLIAWGMIFLILSASLTVGYFDYVKKFFLGSTDIDIERFLNESNDIKVTSEYVADKKGFDYYINDFATKNTSYWQDGNYYFSISPVLKHEKLVVYKEDLQMGNEIKSYDSLYVHIIEAGGRNIAVFAEADVDFNNINEIQGILTKPATSLLGDIAKQLEADKPLMINEYILDTRGIEMGMENAVLLLIVLFLLIGLFMVTKGIVYFIKPQLAPTYRQLKKYGDIDDIIRDIEAQIKGDNVQYEKGKIYTEDWILIQSSFKKKVEKNPAKGHQFKYTPEI